MLFKSVLTDFLGWKSSFSPENSIISWLISIEGAENLEKSGKNGIFSIFFKKKRFLGFLLRKMEFWQSFYAENHVFRLKIHLCRFGIGKLKKNWRKLVFVKKSRFWLVKVDFYWKYHDFDAENHVFHLKIHIFRLRVGKIRKFS